MFAVDVASGDVLLDSGAFQPTVTTVHNNTWTLYANKQKQAAGLVYWPGNAASGPLVIAGFASHCERHTPADHVPQAAVPTKCRLQVAQQAVSSQATACNCRCYVVLAWKVTGLQYPTFGDSLPRGVTLGSAVMHTGSKELL